MPELDTTIDRSAETLERLMAALVAAGTAKMDPTGGQGDLASLLRQSGAGRSMKVAGISTSK